MKQEDSQYDILIVTGITATGKTSLTAHLASKLKGEIISADSRQVFKGMSIGTGKDLDDYVVNGKQIPYYLVDICEPGETYSVFRFQKDFINAYNTIKSHGRLPILCGGTGLYVESVVKQYRLLDVPRNQKLRDELSDKTLEQLSEILAGMKNMHNETDIDTRQRAIRAIEIEEYQKSNHIEETNMPELTPLVVAPSFDRPQIRKRITNRLYERLEEGMIDEVRQLLDSGIDPEILVSYGLEYKYLTWYITGKMNYNTMVERLNIAIHQFAKRQMTWFRRMERKGIKIHWIDGYMSTEQKTRQIIQLLNQ